MTKTIAAIQSDARKFAAIFKDDSEVNRQIGLDIDRYEEGKLADLYIMLAIEKEVGAAKLAELPEPDSGPEGNNPDVYEETNGDSKRKGSFWGDAALDLPHLKRWGVRKQTMTEALKNQMDPAFAEFWGADKGEDWIKKEKSMMTARLTRGQNKFRNGARLVYRIARLRAEYTHAVTVMLDGAKDKDGVFKFNRVKGPIVLIKKMTDESPLPNVRRLSVGEFLALNIDRAIERGNSFDSLLASGKRETKTPDLSKEVQSVGTFANYMISLLHFLNDENNRTKVVNFLIKEDSREDAKNTSEVYLALDTLLKGSKKMSEVFDEVTGMTPQPGKNAPALENAKAS